MNNNNNNNSRKKNNRKYKRDSSIVAEKRPYRLTIRQPLCPDELRVTLKYNQVFTLTSTLGVGANRLFRGNGPFDPDFTGIGQQPTGYDEWSGFYASQRTLGSRIRAQCYPATVGGYAIGALVVAPLQGTTAISTAVSLDSIKSAKFAKWCNNTYLSEPKSLTLDVSSALVLGRFERAIEDDDTYSSGVGNVPGTEWVWQVSVADVTGTTTSYNVTVELEYDIVFFKRLSLVQS